jgi:para-nitrobenzyl esterase
VPFSPVVDGTVLPATPWQALRDGAGRHLDLLVGHTRDEQRLFSAVLGLLGEVGDELATTALDILSPKPVGAQGYRSAYPEASPETLYELVHSDWLFRMPSLHLAESQARAGGRVFLYELTWAAPGMGGALGACHGLDVPLVFGTLDRGQPAMLIGAPPPAEALALSARVRAAWAGFATTGAPGWPAYDLAGRLTQVLDTEPTVAAYPEEPSRLLWQDHAFAPLPLLHRPG